MKITSLVFAFVMVVTSTLSLNAYAGGGPSECGVGSPCALSPSVGNPGNPSSSVAGVGSVNYPGHTQTMTMYSDGNKAYIDFWSSTNYYMGLYNANGQQYGGSCAGAGCSIRGT